MICRHPLAYLLGRRPAEYLAAVGHAVIGVDISPEMLAVTREKVPGADFRVGDLHQLPVPGQHVDVVVCAQALTHVRELAPVLAEFVRVPVVMTSIRSIEISREKDGGELP
jgi:ubiquinone/menaquinone biosynthesis C-methylase UbiE